MKYFCLLFALFPFASSAKIILTTFQADAGLELLELEISRP
ncbi:MAG: hypothetical protein ACKVY0_11265 [Prosthecobacter sp.]